MMLSPSFILHSIFVGLAVDAVFILAAVLLQERRFSAKKTVVLWILFGILLPLDFYFCIGFLPEQIKMPMVLLIGFPLHTVIFFYISADGFWKKCYLICSFYCISSISWSVGFYLCYLLPAFNTPPISYAIRVVVYCVITLPILFAYHRYVRPLILRVSGFHKQSWMTLSLFSIMYFLIFAFLMARISMDHGIDKKTLAFFIISVCTFAAGNALSINNIFHMRKEARSNLMRQQMEYLSDQVESARKSEEYVQRFYHDKRHHDEFIASLARAGDTEGILSYLKQERLDSERQQLAFCPNRTVNSILVSYAGKAESEGILFSAKADTGHHMPIADVDLVAILANLLENALHACMNIGSSGPLDARVRMVGRTMVIVVSNPCDDGFRIENGLPVSRGIGIDSIISTAKRYHGEINYSIKNGICTVCVTLNP